MAQRQLHFELAFEEFLRARRIPYVAVNEARKSLLPAALPPLAAPAAAPPSSIKSFDFIVYGQNRNLLVEVKGRRLPTPRASAPRAIPGRRPPRLENWVTREDVESLARWERLFGAGFAAQFVFIYWSDDQPPDGMFHETWSHRDTWYAIRSVPVRDFAHAMRTRSERWGTVDLDQADFERLAQPVAPGPGEEPCHVATPGPAPLPALAPIDDEIPV